MNLRKETLFFIFFMIWGCKARTSENSGAKAIESESLDVAQINAENQQAARKELLEQQFLDRKAKWYEKQFQDAVETMDVVKWDFQEPLKPVTSRQYLREVLRGFAAEDSNGKFLINNDGNFVDRMALGVERRPEKYKDALVCMRNGREFMGNLESAVDNSHSFEIRLNRSTSYQFSFGGSIASDEVRSLWYTDNKNYKMAFVAIKGQHPVLAIMGLREREAIPNYATATYCVAESLKDKVESDYPIYGETPKERRALGK
jgi:hypothetical protein